MTLVEQYVRRFVAADGSGLTPPRVEAPIPWGLGVCVVIPARAEGDFTAVLDSLCDCARPTVPVEVLVVLNSGEEDDAEIGLSNEISRQAIAAWSAAAPRWFQCHVIEEYGVKRRWAGVGTARKVGLDEGLRRLAAGGSDAALNGVLASLDADCTVSPDYFTALERAFARPEVDVATIYFEHDLEHASPRFQAMVEYELYLRCHVAGLRFARAPLAVHCVGSCIAVRARTYLQLGGMNRRQAGEDFYFLNKAAQRGPITELATPVVRPAARVSTRTPFGTGQALANAKDAQELRVYDPEVYRVIRDVYVALDSVFDGIKAQASEEGASDVSGLDTGDLFGIAAPYFERLSWRSALASVTENVSGRRAFEKRVRVWFDGFQVMKLCQWLTATQFPKIGVSEAARIIAELAAPTRDASSQGPGTNLVRVSDGSAVTDKSSLDWLLRYRTLDRERMDAPGKNATAEAS